jgi:hypothetical protein
VALMLTSIMAFGLFGWLNVMTFSITF